MPVDPIIELIANLKLIPNQITMEYKASEGFDKPNGKFPNTLGNVAIIDCNYAFSSLGYLFDDMGNKIEGNNPFLYSLIKDKLTTIK